MLYLNVVTGWTVYFLSSERNVKAQRKLDSQRIATRSTAAQPHHSTSKDSAGNHTGYGLFCARCRAETQGNLESASTINDNQGRSSTSSITQSKELFREGD